MSLEHSCFLSTSHLLVSARPLELSAGKLLLLVHYGWLFAWSFSTAWKPRRLDRLNATPSGFCDSISRITHLFTIHHQFTWYCEKAISLDFRSCHILCSTSISIRSFTFAGGGSIRADRFLSGHPHYSDLNRIGNFILVGLHIQFCMEETLCFLTCLCC